jgi:hypothetical protein
MTCRRITRLAFALACGFLAPMARLPAQTPIPAPPAPPPLSPVILAESPDVVQRFAVNGDVVRDMVDRELLKLTSAPDIGTAWTRLGVVPADVVGIKITTMGGPLLSSHRVLVQAICDGLQAAGVSPGHIIIWDKFGEDMRRAGYLPQQGTDEQVAIASVFPGTGYDTKTAYKNEILGTLIWGDSEFLGRSGDDIFQAARDAVNAKPFGGGSGNSLTDTANDYLLNGGAAIPQTSNLSYYDTLLSKTCSKIINVPVLTDNAPVGINGCLATLALAAVDNNRRFQGDPTYGDPAICEILDKDFMRRKVIVHILDALVAQYAGGPTFDPVFTQQIGAIYVSRDPVAIDSLVVRRIEAWRRQARIDPLGKTTSHINSAALYNLGTNDPHRIQLIRIQP